MLKTAVGLCWIVFEVKLIFTADRNMRTVTAPGWQFQCQGMSVILSDWEVLVVFERWTETSLFQFHPT